MAPEDTDILRKQVSIVVYNYRDSSMYMNFYRAMASVSLVFKVFLLLMGLV